jgi:hypothetical protein
MSYKSDIEIAQGAQMNPIKDIAASLNIPEDAIDLYGNTKCKVNYNLLNKLQDKPDGKLILVTVINPTPAGEGKTTTTVGLGDALRRLGKRAVIALREPSLGPVFGIKGGAAGGGYAQVVPMEDINLHFTGDLHAIGAANNLLAAMLDNHIYQGNELGLDVRKITWKRCMDMNDRQLRFMVNGLNGRTNGVPREDGFDITVASEIMAILCLSKDMEDLKEKLRSIIVGYTVDDQPVTAGQLKAEGAMAVLLKDALKPNLVQTLENTPAFVHGGPFANIAHGSKNEATKEQASPAPSSDTISSDTKNDLDLTSNNSSSKNEGTKDQASPAPSAGTKSNDTINDAAPTSNSSKNEGTKDQASPAPSSDTKSSVTKDNASPKPGAVSNLKMARASSSTAKLSWTAGSGAASYEVQYYSQASGGWKTDPDYKTKTSKSYTTTERQQLACAWCG